MKRKDYILIGLLLALMFLWPTIDRTFIRPLFPTPPAPPPGAATNEPAATVTTTGAVPATSIAAPAPAATAAVAAAAAPAAPATSGVEAVEAPREPERIATVTNDRMAVAFSSRGASVSEVTLRHYRATIAKDSGPVVLDFGARRALAYRDFPGFDENTDFALDTDQAASNAVFRKRLPSGLELVRTVQLDATYGLTITDVFTNTSDQALSLPAYGVQLGRMTNDFGHVKDPSGLFFLSVDTLSPGGEPVQFWASRIKKMFEADKADRSLPKLPVEIERAPRERAVDWVAVKNKYFVQILAPENGGEGVRLFARRALDPREALDPAFNPSFTTVDEVGATVDLAAHVLGPGQSLARTAQYYVGPKKYSELRARRLHQDDVMEFRIDFFLFSWMNPIISPCAKLLLRVLNALHDFLPPHSYGLAIILLTVLVRVVFWPVTHKSTQSMKRMAEVQPLVKALQAKYKDNPQKMQQEMMKLYREHKINPLGGCLPMLIQIPVFMALFLVLRSAIELRFAPFLWIRDLSMPERIFEFGFTIPLVGWDALNLLPILMTATQFVQTKLTPTAGDPQQQRMMMIMMPIMMLFFLYNFASGLALYWTTQNILMIVQQVLTRRHAAKPKPA